MSERIAIVGAGAVGAYVGGYLSRAGRDVTLIDPWPEHVEAMRSDGLTLAGMTGKECFHTPVKAMHLTEVQGLHRQGPIDIAFVTVKSYDTAWATTMIQDYLAPDGTVVAAELHQRGDHRPDRRLGPRSRLHRRQDRRGADRSGPGAARRAARRRQAHGVPGRRGARPDHAAD